MGWGCWTKGAGASRASASRSGEVESDYLVAGERVACPSSRLIRRVYPSRGPAPPPPSPPQPPPAESSKEGQADGRGKSRTARAAANAEPPVPWRVHYARLMTSQRSDIAELGREPPLAVCLYNLGNSCYANAVLQLLLHADPLREFLCSELAAAYARAEARLYPAFVGFFHAAWTSRRLRCPALRLDPSTVYAAMEAVTELPDEAGTQHDAHELLSLVLDALSEELNPVASSSAQVQEDAPDGGTIHHRWAAALAAEARINLSPLDPRLRFWEASELVCSGCGAASTSFAPSAILSLPIPAGAKSLLECVRAYFAPEMTEWQCPRGCRRASAWHRIRFLRPPRILILHLRRFTNALRRLNVCLKTPAALDMSEFAHTAIPPESAAYSLRSVLCHSGRLESGHYTTYTVVDGSWLKLDDDDLFVIKPHVGQLPSAFHGHKPYIFLYQRQSYN